jgi:hypothetical protein
VWGLGSQAVLYYLDVEGEVVDSIALPVDPARLTRAEVGEALAARAARASGPEERGFWNDMFHHVPFPSEHPLFDQLLLGPDNLVWLRSPERGEAGEEGYRRWTAFDRASRHRAVLSMPPDYRVHQFLEGAVLTVHTLKTGAEQVVVLSLTQAQPPS